MNIEALQVIELPPFQREATKVFDQEELSSLKIYIKENPCKGDVIQGTGGVRKLRWSAGSKGKRGGARVIYFYFMIARRIYLMSCYSKNVKTDISPKAKKDLKAFIDKVKEGYAHAKT